MYSEIAALRSAAAAANVIVSTAALLFLFACAEAPTTEGDSLEPSGKKGERSELFLRQRQLLEKMINTKPTLGAPPNQQLNASFNSMLGKFLEKFKQEWQNPAAMAEFFEEQDEKGKSIVDRLNNYYRLYVCFNPLEQRIRSGDRAAIRGMIELITHEKQAGFWNVIQDKAGTYIPDPQLKVLENTVPEAKVFVRYDLKPIQWYEAVYRRWVSWWDENNRYLQFSQNKKTYFVNEEAKKTGRAIDSISGDKLTPEQTEKYESSLSKLMNWIKDTRLMERCEHR